MNVLGLSPKNLGRVNLAKLFTENSKLLEMIRRVSARQLMQQEFLSRGESVDEYRKELREETVAALGAVITAITREVRTLPPLTEQQLNVQNPDEQNLTPDHSLLATMMGALANAAASNNLSLEQPPMPEIFVPKSFLSEEKIAVAEFVSTNMYYTMSLKGEFVGLAVDDIWCDIFYKERGETLSYIHGVKNTIFLTAIEQMMNNEQQQILLPNIIGGRQPSDQNVLHNRGKIGCGVRLDVRNGTELWATCLSSMPLSAESLYLDKEAGRDPHSCIHKIYQQSTLKIFDIRQIGRQMCYTNAHRRFILGRIPESEREAVNQVSY